MTALTYDKFGERVGCNYTTVSRLLSGERGPSTRLLGTICAAYELDEGEALRALHADHVRNDGLTTEFARFLREKVFEPAHGEPLDSETPT